MGLVYLAISQWYYEYVRYFLYFSIIVMIPIVVIKAIKQRKEDNTNGTKLFQSSIYSMLIVIAVLMAFFFLTQQDYK